MFSGLTLAEYRRGAGTNVTGYWSFSNNPVPATYNFLGIMQYMLLWNLGLTAFPNQCMVPRPWKLIIRSSMSKNSRSNPNLFLTQVLMNLPLLHYSWLKTQKGLVDDSVLFKFIFHWLRWSYNRVALVVTLQQKRSHSI